MSTPGKPAVITAGEAQPDDVILDAGGTAWQRGAEFYNWATFAGLVFYEGPWDPATMGPQGELYLLVRDGKPQVAARAANVKSQQEGGADDSKQADR